MNDRKRQHLARFSLEYSKCSHRHADTFTLHWYTMPTTAFTDLTVPMVSNGHVSEEDTAVSHIGNGSKVSNTMVLNSVSTLGALFLEKRHASLTELTKDNTMACRISKYLVLDVSDISDTSTFLVDRYKKYRFAMFVNSYDNFIAVSVKDNYVLEITSRQKNSIVSLHAGVYACDTDTINIAVSKMEAMFEDVIRGAEVSMSVRWYYTQEGSTDYIIVEESFNETFYPNAYPDIADIDDWINEYIDSSEQILVLYGPPGTGKTRLIREICHEISKRCEDNTGNFMYTVDKHVLDNDYLFTTLLSNDSQHALILEDLDQHLGTRKSGNDVMTRLLTGSDGFISNPNKKIIITTNLINISHIDEALLRPGRCYDCMNVRPLTLEQSITLAQDLNPDIDTGLFTEPVYTLSEVFKTARKNARFAKKTRGIGFH